MTTTQHPALSRQPLPPGTLTIYLSGPMTGYPEHNFPAFTWAAAALRQAGFAVLAPHEKDLQEGFDPESDGSDFDLRAALEWDIEAVLVSDVVVVLPGWEDSPGCAIEIATAASLGLPVVTLAEALAPDFRLIRAG